MNFENYKAIIQNYVKCTYHCKRSQLRSVIQELVTFLVAIFWTNLVSHQSDCRTDVTEECSDLQPFSWQSFLLMAI